jgi:hypothetical protein
MDKPNGMNGKGGAEKITRIRPFVGPFPPKLAPVALQQLSLRDDFRGPYSKFTPSQSDVVPFRAAAGSDDLMSQPQSPASASPEDAKGKS